MSTLRKLSPGAIASGGFLGAASVFVALFGSVYYMFSRYGQAAVTLDSPSPYLSAPDSAAVWIAIWATLSIASGFVTARLAGHDELLNVALACVLFLPLDLCVMTWWGGSTWHFRASLLTPIPALLGALIAGADVLLRELSYPAVVDASDRQMEGDAVLASLNITRERWEEKTPQVREMFQELLSIFDVQAS